MGTQLFDQLIGDVPPSTVDVAGIVRREKRRSGIRRIAGVATAVVALSVTTAIGLTMTNSTGASSPPVAGGASVAGTVVPDTRFALVANSEESAAASAKRLGAALAEAFRKEAPTAKWIFDPELPGQTGPDGRPPKLSHRVVDGKTKKSQELFHGGSGVLNEGRKGRLHLGVNAVDRPGEDGTPNRDAGTCPPAGDKCTPGKAPNGAKTVLLTRTFEDTEGLVQTAEVALPDGRALRITQSNNFGVGGGGPAQQATPLTSAQLMAIAIDVAGRIKA
jgi:hypothetical protein